MGVEIINLRRVDPGGLQRHNNRIGGTLEAAICVMAMQNGVMPPTVNLIDPDPECDLDYIPLKARCREINVCVSDSFGFGGHNSVLVFTKPDWAH